jgi:MFS family permease
MDAATTPPTDPAPLTASHRKVILASSLGTVFEWYDFYLYGSLAAIIAKQFFSALDPTSGFIFALLAFAAGFAVRPFGALVFGRLGDLVGRKYTFLVAFLPNYAQWGIAAPVLLITLRLLQGLALGGEYGGAATYVAEHAPAGKRGLYTSFIQTTATLGLFLSLLVILGLRLALGTEAFEAWGWRIPFLLSAVLVAVGWYIRNRVAESPMFRAALEEAEDLPKLPAIDVLRERPGGLLLGAGLRVGENISYYILTVFSLTFLVDVAAESRALALEALLIGAAVQFFAIPLFGRLSDRIGRRPVYAFGGLGLAAFICFFFNMLASGSTAAIIAAIIIGLVLHSAMYGPQAAFITEQFPTRLRYSGVSIAYQLTSIAAGSLAPIIALWLYKDYGSATPVAIYVGVACAISGVCALLAKETRGLELDAIR